MTERLNYPTVGGFFKAVFGVNPTPERQQELKNELIQSQARRIEELERKPEPSNVKQKTLYVNRKY
jgi:hypothetical protein